MRKTICALFLVTVANGCGPPVYRIRTTVPWPDDWLVGPRHPDRIDLPLSFDTVLWHERTSMRALRTRVERIAASYPNALILIRHGFGDLRGKTGHRENALAFLEVRVTAWPLPNSRESRQFNWNIGGVSLEKVLSQFSVGLGEELILSGEVDGAMPITFQAEELGAPEALACLLLQNGLYLAPACLGTSVLRSYEYKTPNAFLGAVQTRLAEASNARSKGPYTILTMGHWTQLHEAQLASLNLWPSARTAAFPGRGRPRGDSRPPEATADVQSGISPQVATITSPGDRAERARRYLSRVIQLRLAKPPKPGS